MVMTMPDIYLNKRYGTLMPASEADADIINTLADGETFKCAFSRPRNTKFHRKYFALLDVLFECFNPVPVDFVGGKSCVGKVPMKNRERFRKDIAIATGHFDLVVTLKNEVRADAKSISFASMNEVEFSQLYSLTIDYGLQKMTLKNGCSQSLIFVEVICVE
jgi:hypothetical protein